MVLITTGLVAAAALLLTMAAVRELRERKPALNPASVRPQRPGRVGRARARGPSSPRRG